MFAHQRKRLRLVLLSADAILTAISFESAYFTRAHLGIPGVFSFDQRTNLVTGLFCVITWATLGWTRGVYEHMGIANFRTLARATLRQCVIGILLVVTLQYIISPPHEHLSRTFLAIFGVYTFAALLLFRLVAPLLVGAFQRGFGEAYHIVLVGSTDRLPELEHQICSASPYRTMICARLTTLEAEQSLPSLLAKDIVDEVIFSTDWLTLSKLESVILYCDEEGVRTRIVADFFPHVNSRITMDHVGTLPLLTFSADPLGDVRLLIKRLMDGLVSLIMLLLLLPVFAVIVLLIKATSPGPVIYRQVRCGLNGRQFTLYKFRSMVANAEALRADLEHLNERQIAFKLSNDPRVTRVGGVLRKYSLDELPQFYNVLKGDMSLVGPRPPLSSEVSLYERWQKRRLRMRPGLTCLWAILGRDTLDFQSWMKADLFYIDNWSLGLDLHILVRTIPKVVSGRGAH